MWGLKARLFWIIIGIFISQIYWRLHVRTSQLTINLLIQWWLPFKLTPFVYYLPTLSGYSLLNYIIVGSSFNFFNFENWDNFQFFKNLFSYLVQFFFFFFKNFHAQFFFFNFFLIYLNFLVLLKIFFNIFF